MPPYDRSLYEHWTDDDGDCLNTRHEVLIAESQSPPRLDPSGCFVLEGLWFDPYSGQRISDPAKLDVDHLIPLAEAHRSGAAAWQPEKRRQFANDLSHPRSLIAVTAGLNRAKRDRDPARWLPPNEAYRCQYVHDWVITKATWGLEMDPDEREAVREILWKCGVAGPGQPSDRPPGAEAATGRDPGRGSPAARSERSTGAAAEERGPRAESGPKNAQTLASATAADPELGVPEYGCEQPPGSPCIDVNAATFATLQCVDGLGPTKARAVIDFIKSNGPFQDLQELQNVRGIGPRTVDSIRRAGFCIGAEDGGNASETAGAP